MSTHRLLTYFLLPVSRRFPSAANLALSRAQLRPEHRYRIERFFT